MLANQKPLAPEPPSYGAGSAFTVNNIAADKKALRAEAKARRATLGVSARAVHSARIVSQLLEDRDVQAAQRILAYHGFGEEIDTSKLLAAVLKSGQTLMLPRIETTPAGASRLQIYVVNDLSRDLRPGPWGLREPDPARCEPADLSTLELIIVPGLAFSPTGQRLGYGRGYYDRLLERLPAETRPILLAGAFETQLWTSIPTEPHDKPVDRIVTEARQVQCVHTQRTLAHQPALHQQDDP